jgi:catechol 2,3-dioxygenase-like lactoylglutathione lyase family enzyme
LEPARPQITLDHCVVHVSDWARSNAFYAEVLGAEVVPVGAGFAYRFGAQQLNLHGPGLTPEPVARLPVAPGNSDLCFVWPGTAEEAAVHLARCGVPVELGPVPRNGARGPGRSVYFRDPDGSLLELISYAGG